MQYPTFKSTDEIPSLAQVGSYFRLNMAVTVNMIHSNTCQCFQNTINVLRMSLENSMLCVM